MSIPHILSTIYAFKVKTGRAPKSNQKELAAVIKESQRKIGTWRKTLWCSRAIDEERKKNLPQFAFVMDGHRWRLNDRSYKLFRKLSPKNDFKKETMN